MNRKSLSLFCAIAALLTCLAGCAKSENAPAPVEASAPTLPDVDTETPAPEENETPAPEEAPAAAPVAPVAPPDNAGTPAEEQPEAAPPIPADAPAPQPATVETAPAETRPEDAAEEPVEVPVPPTPAEPTPAAPATAEPAPAQPAASEPAPTEPVEPVSAPVPEPEPAPAEPAPAGVSLADVRQAIIAGVGVEDPLTLETPALYGLYGIDASWVAQSASFVTMSGTFPDEVILIEAADAAALEQISGCLQHRLDEVMNQAQSYDPESYAAAQTCRVVTNGLFIRLILSASQADMAAIYGQYVS